MTIRWTITAAGDVVADRSADPLVGSLLLPAVAAATLFAAVAAGRLLAGRDRAVAAVAYGLAELALLALCGSQLLLIWLNLG